LPEWLSSTAAADGCQQYCGAAPVRPVPDQYALVTNEQADRPKDIALAQLNNIHTAQPTLHMYIKAYICKAYEYA